MKKTHLLGFDNINDQEAGIMAKSITTGFTDDETGRIIPPVSLDHALDQMILIDRLLSVSKTYQFMNKRHGLKRNLEVVIDNHYGFKPDLNLNSKKRC